MDRVPGTAGLQAYEDFILIILEEYMKKISAYILGAFAGAVIISGLVLLLAPTSGKELRERIRMKYLELQNEFKTASQERREELEAQLAKLRKGLPAGD